MYTCTVYGIPLIYCIVDNILPMYCTVHDIPIKWKADAMKSPVKRTGCQIISVSVADDSC